MSEIKKLADERIHNECFKAECNDVCDVFEHALMMKQKTGTSQREGRPGTAILGQLLTRLVKPKARSDRPKRASVPGELTGEP